MSIDATTPSKNPGTALVLGATGATGRLLVRELLARGWNVRAIVRSREKLPDDVRDHARLAVIEAGIAEMSNDDLGRHVAGCNAVASCLGHTLSFRGIFGQPRRLVTDAVRRACRAIERNRPAAPVRFVLMNTTGNRNRDLDERVSLAERCVLGLLRLLIPPHADNEQAADFLRTAIGPSHPAIEWAAVRPDSLIDRDAVAEYDAHPSPTRSAIFDAGRTSRIQVAHFMAELITEDDAWRRWKGRMPVMYDRG